MNPQVISAQQLPRLKDASGREIIDKAVIDPFIEVSIHVPDWTQSHFLPTSADTTAYTAPTAPTFSPVPKPSSSTSTIKVNSPASASSSTVNSTAARTITYRTGFVRNNGFNPVWQEDLHLPFDCVGDMMDLVFVRFAVRHEGSEGEPLALYCTSLGSLQQGES
jgi:phosphatidylinositol phospholipase C, delta